MNKIQQFIENNSLNFTSAGSELNGNCVVLAGYALYENGNVNDYNKLLEDIEEDGLYDLTTDVSVELERVFNYAYSNDYAKWWESEEARKMYKF